MLSRVYVEIGNVCNLNCEFCAGTKREPGQMTEERFRTVCERLSGYTEDLYFHVMGEPLLHGKLGELIDIANGFGYRVHITTNGTLLHRRGYEILKRAGGVSNVSISLHSKEGNVGSQGLDAYLDSVIAFGRALAERGSYTVYRLWNLDSDEGGGKNKYNAYIEERLRDEYREPWQKRYRGFRIAHNTFLEYDGVFTWPSESEADPRDEGRCHALRSQIAILVDGTVVPCCLDSEGLMPLGNIFDCELSEILESERAVAMRRGFENGKMVHPVCKKCTYARRFKI